MLKRHHCSHIYGCEHYVVCAHTTTTNYVVLNYMCTQTCHDLHCGTPEACCAYGIRAIYNKMGVVGPLRDMTYCAYRDVTLFSPML